MKNKKLQIKISLTIVLLVSILLLGVIIVSYNVTKDSLTQSIDNQLSTFAQSNAHKINGLLIEKSQIVKTTGDIISDALTKNTSNEKDLRNLISKSHLSSFKTDDEIYSLYIGYESDGSFLDGGNWVAPSGYDARSRSWFSDAKNQGKLTYSILYPDAATGNRYVLTSSIPVYVDNKLFGVVAASMHLTTVNEIINNGDYKYQDSYAILIDDKGNIMSHPSEELLGQSMLEIEELQSIGEKMLSDKTGQFNYVYGNLNKIIHYHEIESTGWVLGIAAPQSEVYKPLMQVKSLYGTILFLAIVCAIICAYFIARYITKPIEEIASVAQKVSHGDLTQRSSIRSKDEIGHLSRSFNQMVEQLQQMVQNIHLTSNEINDSSDYLASISAKSKNNSEEISENINLLVNENDNEHSMIIRTTDTVSEMAKGIEQIADKTQSTTHNSVTARESVSKGKVTVDNAIESMQQIENIVGDSMDATLKLGSTSKEIGSIVQLITDIAEQTNLLALNAAIEAARAGEQGKGFAVVAEEVRKLAVQSSDAASKITHLIEEVQLETTRTVKLMQSGNSAVQEGSKKVSDTKHVFNTIYQSIDEIASNIEEMSSATEEIYAGSEDVVTTIHEIALNKDVITRNTKNISEAVVSQTTSIQEISSSAEQLNAIAQSLQDIIKGFKAE